VINVITQTLAIS